MQADVHFARTNTEKQFPGDGILSVDGIEQCGLRVEGKVTADRKLYLIGGPQVTNTAESISAYAE